MGSNDLNDAISIIGDTSLSIESRIDGLSRLDLSSDDMRIVGSALYSSMLSCADVLRGDVSAMTCIYLVCSDNTLMNIIHCMIDQNHIRWILNKIESFENDPRWRLCVTTFGADDDSARTLGDILLMSAVLSQADIDMNQSFTREHH